jgi:hypothetical protein
MSAKEKPMQYLLLIYEEEKIWTTMPESERMQIYGEYRKYTDEIKASGHWKGGNPLQPTHTATTVRVRGGKVSTTDGPFAETREQLGGYYLVEAKDLDEANRLAAGIPGAKLGSIEVRPIMPIGP